MKPIDVQNNALLGLARGEATPNRLTTNLRAGGMPVNLGEVGRALVRLEEYGLAVSVGHEHVAGTTPRPIYTLTTAGKAEASRLIEGAEHG